MSEDTPLPDTVALSYHSGILTATGSAPADWVDQSRVLARAIAGVEQYRTQSLVIPNHDPGVLAAAHELLDPPDTVTLYFHEGLLTATGSAPREWIRLGREKWPSIDGVHHYDDELLIDSDRREFHRV